MARRRAAEKREVLPDPKYGDAVLSRFMNAIMLHGKKSGAERIVYGAFDKIESRTSRAPLELFHEALDNVKPPLEVRSRRVGGATYQVPVDIRAERRTSLAMRWLVRSARGRRGRSMSEKLAGELMDASTGQGAAVKRREDTHRMAEANRAFVHYRW
jgi:small subunit ribosomal protein S7